MENASQLSSDEILRAPHSLLKIVQLFVARLRLPAAAIPNASGLGKIAYSFADQALAVGGSFLVNVMLARTQSKEEYGIFALSYSIFTFLTGLYNAAILEPYTVYGSGRYRDRFSEYLRLMTRSQFLVGALLSAIVLLICLVLAWIAPHFVSGALLGLGAAVGILLSGVFMRRVFYLQGEPALAAKSSFVFFLTVAGGLWLASRARLLGSFSVFLILALGWIAAAVCFGRKLDFGSPKRAFLELEPHYWRAHWNYAQWVLATAFVFQFTTQGFYWLVAGVLSVKQVAELRVLYMLVTPIDQVFIALSFLVIPALAARYASKRMEEFLSFSKRYLVATVGATSLFVLAVRLAGRPVMHWLYAGKFDDLAPLLYVLAFLPLLMGIGNAMSSALNAAERPRIVFYAYLCSGAATFLLGIPLMIHFGLRGAVYGMLVSGSTYSVVLAAGFFLNIYGKSHQPELSDLGKEPAQCAAASIRSAPIRRSQRFAQSTRLAPIALFVYNRPEHTRRTVEALRANELAQQSDLFVFADGAKNESAASAVEAVKKLIRTIDGFKSVTVTERKENLGLSNSIISGVAQLCDEFGRVIAVEDDVVTAPDFLTFMNHALDRYADELRIFSVSSFNYPMIAPESYPYDVFFSYRFPCWGWGTWKDRWEKADWSVSDFPEFIADRERQKRFDRGGEDLTWMLTLKMAGKLDGCWDVVWGYTHSKHDAVALLPVSSKAYNIGLDGSGAHCARAPFRQTALNSGNSSDYRFPDFVDLDPYFVAVIQQLHRPSIARKFVRFLRRCAPGMKWCDSRRVSQAKT